MKNSDDAKLGTVAVSPIGQSDGVPRHPDTAPGLAVSGCKMTSLPWFPFFPADFVSSAAVKQMTLEQVGAYCLLLNWQWLSNACVLLDDIPTLNRMVGCDMSSNDMAIVLSKFPVVSQGFRGNPRLLEVYKEQMDKHLRRVEAGKQAHDKEGNAGSNATGNAGSSTIQNSELRTQMSESQSLQTDIVCAQLRPRLCALFHRRLTTEWDDKEVRKLKEMAKRKDVLRELTELEAYHKTLASRGESRFFRHDLITLLNNWSCELDRARRNTTGTTPTQSTQAALAQTAKNLKEALS